MRGQQSIEYMIIVGATLVLVLAATAFYFGFSQARDARSVAEQVNQAGRQIVESGRQTFLLGQGARETLTVRLPSGVQRVYVVQANPYELVIQYRTRLGTSDAVFFSPVNISTPYPDGNLTNTHVGTFEIQFNALYDRVHMEVQG